MKRYIALALLAAMFLCFLPGCSWMNGEFVYEEPKSLENSDGAKNAIAVTSYTQMYNALVNLVESGANAGILDVSNFNDGSVRFFMDAAIRYVTTSNAMGAYVVDDIYYEIGTSTGEQAVALEIKYRFGRDHVMKIVRTYGMDEAKKTLVDAMQTFTPNVVLRVSKYEDLDLAQWIAEYALTHPETVIEVPQIDVNIYPQKGTDRIISLDFTYSYSDDELTQMRQSVSTILNTALPDTELAPADSDKYTMLYHFLTEQGIYTLDEMTDTPVYSVLVNNTGDSAAFSSVYAMLCERSGLECHVVPGTYDDQPRMWNIICVDDQYYHFDLLRCYQDREFVLYSSSEMRGYIWDYGSFPQ